MGRELDDGQALTVHYEFYAGSQTLRPHSVGAWPDAAELTGERAIFRFGAGQGYRIPAAGANLHRQSLCSQHPDYHNRGDTVGPLATAVTDHFAYPGDFRNAVKCQGANLTSERLF